MYGTEVFTVEVLVEFVRSVSPEWLREILGEGEEQFDEEAYVRLRSALPAFWNGLSDRQKQRILGMAFFGNRISSYEEGMFTFTDPESLDSSPDQSEDEPE